LTYNESHDQARLSLDINVHGIYTFRSRKGK
jgi:hypothetical protein